MKYSNGIFAIAVFVIMMVFASGCVSVSASKVEITGPDSMTDTFIFASGTEFFGTDVAIMRVKECPPEASPTNRCILTGQLGGTSAGAGKTIFQNTAAAGLMATGLGYGLANSGSETNISQHNSGGQGGAGGMGGHGGLGLGIGGRGGNSVSKSYSDVNVRNFSSQTINGMPGKHGGYHDKD